MNNMILIPFAGEMLALKPEQFQSARLAGAEIMPGSVTAVTDNRARNNAAGNSNQLLTSGQIAQLTGVPRTWFESAARTGKIPFYQFGKYVRFDLDEVNASTAVKSLSDAHTGKAAKG